MDRKKIILMGLAVVGLAAFAWFNSLPRASRASGGPLDEFWLYGITADDGQLFRYDFGAGAVEPIGSVHIDEGSPLSGIGGMAYVPGNLSAFGFWSDPSDGLTKLVYVNTKTGKASVVGQDLGLGRISAATAVLPASAGLTLPGTTEKTPSSVRRAYEVYAVREAPSISFAIDNGEVIPSEEFAAKVEVLGAAITMGGTYDVPVTVRVRVAGDEFEPFGPYGKPVEGTVNDGGNPRRFVAPGTYNSGDAVSVQARAWEKTSSSYDGSQDSHWRVLMEVDSASGSAQVLTLRNGDAVPSIAPFLDQTSLATFIQDYVNPDSGKVELGDNQAIYLFELGTTSLLSLAADYQDLVVLVTLAEEPTAFDTGSESVTYAVAPQGDGVRFANPETALGEGGAVETDYFEVSVTGGGAEVTATTQASTVEATSVLSGVGSEATDANGFRLSLVGVSDGTYTLAVTSESAPYTLNRVDFHFGDGSSVTSPVDHYDALRVEDVSAGGSPVVSELVRVDTKTAQTEHVMGLGRNYEALAAVTADEFFGSTGSELYLIDPVAGTETLIGPLSQAGVSALEFAGATLYGFSTAAQQLISNDTSTALAGTSMSIPVSSVSSIFFQKRADEPTTFIGFD